MSVRKRTTGAGSAWLLGFCENTAEDLKSPAPWGVRVQVSPPAPSVYAGLRYNPANKSSAESKDLIEIT